MFNCCNKRVKVIPKKKRADSYSEFSEVCINKWNEKNKNIDITQIAPKPPTPVSTMNRYIKQKNEKNKINNK